jgi:hypothetical protein
MRCNEMKWNEMNRYDENRCDTKALKSWFLLQIVMKSSLSTMKYLEMFEHNNFD